MIDIQCKANRSGDDFRIYQADGEWVAEQVTGLEKNYMYIPATLRQPSYQALLGDLSRHSSN